MTTTYNPSLTINQNKIISKRAQYDALQAKIEIADTTKALLNTSETIKIQEASITETQVNSARIKQSDLLNEIAQLEASIQSQPGSEVVTSDFVPMIYGTKSLVNNVGGRSMTSEWGTQNLQTFTDNMLSVMMNLNTTPASNYVTAIPYAQRAWKESPDFKANVKTKYVDFPKSLTPIYDYGASDYTGTNFMIFAFKNLNVTTPQTFTFKFRGLAYTTFSRLCLNMYTPNSTNTNRSSITMAAFSNEFDITSGTITTLRTDTITIPADKSILLVLMSADKYVTSNTSGRDLSIEDFSDIFNNTDIVPDFDLIENLRRSMTRQKINDLQNFASNIPDLWKLIPTPTVLQVASESADVRALAAKNLTSTRFYATNAAAIAATLSPGSTYYNTTSFGIDIVLPEFANNAAALSGGLSIGQPYWNTTTVDKSLVI
jgi:hypothetical protein